jgi:hypothetical protein
MKLALCVLPGIRRGSRFCIAPRMASTDSAAQVKDTNPGAMRRHRSSLTINGNPNELNTLPGNQG